MSFLTRMPFRSAKTGSPGPRSREYRDLNGGAKQTMTVNFDHLVKARYVKYQQLETLYLWADRRQILWQLY